MNCSRRTPISSGSLLVIASIPLILLATKNGSAQRNGGTDYQLDRKWLPLTRLHALWLKPPSWMTKQSHGLFAVLS